MISRDGKDTMVCRRHMAAVAPANRTARMAWKMMLTGEAYGVEAAAAASAGAV